jgi:hypothetical protein
MGVHVINLGARNTRSGNITHVRSKQASCRNVLSPFCQDRRSIRPRKRRCHRQHTNLRVSHERIVDRLAKDAVVPGLSPAYMPSYATGHDSGSCEFEHATDTTHLIACPTQSHALSSCGLFQTLMILRDWQRPMELVPRTNAFPSNTSTRSTRISYRLGS